MGIKIIEITVMDLHRLFLIRIFLSIEQIKRSIADLVKHKILLIIV
jgi:hypothetical protein